MSNNIYDILKKMAGLDAPKQSLTESKSMDTVKELHKQSKKAPVTAKGSIAEAVNAVESQLNEKYMGFKKTVAAVKKGGSAENPEAVAAAIGRKKYGKEKFQKAAAAGKKLGEGIADLFVDTEKMAQQKAKADQNFADRSAKHFASQVGDQYHQQLIKTNPAYRDEYMSQVKDVRSPEVMRKIEKELQAKHDPMGGPTNIDYEKIKKNPMATKAGEQGVDWRPFGPGPKDSFDSDKFGRPVKEGEMDEDVLSPKQKKFAALAEPKDKITYADKIAGAKKGKKTEGNKFSGNLMKARAQGLKQADLDGDGKMEPVHEGQPDGPEYQKAWARTQAERKEWEKSFPGEKYYGSPKSPVERHDMELQKARSADQAAKDATRSPLGRVANTLSRGLFGQELPEGQKSMREGWEEMQKYLEKKRGPESKGGEGKKAGSRYGGSAQKDDDEDLDGEGKPVEKKKGRPKGTGGGAKHSFKKPKD